MIHAYDSEFLNDAQHNLGDLIDYAVNACKYDADTFFEMFIVSGIAEQFEKGNPRYILGVSGIELAGIILDKVEVKKDLPAPEFSLDKSKEYWGGWALAYYQWYTGKSFRDIHQMISFDSILRMYKTLHEADISKFVESVDNYISNKSQDTKLKQIRMVSGLSQKELSHFSDVSLRSIQMYEQRQKNINKAQVNSLVKLARVLGCKIESLLEPSNIFD